MNHLTTPATPADHIAAGSPIGDALYIETVIAAAVAEFGGAA